MESKMSDDPNVTLTIRLIMQGKVSLTCYAAGQNVTDSYIYPMRSYTYLCSLDFIWELKLSQ